MKLFGNRLALSPLFGVFIACFVLIVSAEAKGLNQTFDTVTLDMYVLDPGTGARAVPFTLCNTDDNSRKSYGCTAYPGDETRKYPFNSSTITIGIEGHTQNSLQQGYLHNLVPIEIAMTVVSQPGIPKPLSCVKAQAIAARTYAYYQINSGSTMTNSASHQVYVPYRYSALNTAQQQRVDDAVSEVLYMTTPSNTDPVRAHFGADNDTTTTDGGESYLKSVNDPISLLGTDFGTSNGGMSSRGCSRWAFGHTSSKGPVVDSDPNYPHDNSGDGDFWSVRWDDAKQILTHYYTGIAIRNTSGQIVTPSRRWNPLTVDWNGNAAPPIMQPGISSPVTIQIQNTGVNAFSANYRLSCRWRKPDNSVVNCLSSDIANPDTLITGATNTVNLNVTPLSDFASGTYTLMIDLKIGAQYFHDWEAPDRPWFSLNYAVTIGDGGGGGNGGDIFLPIIHKNPYTPPTPDNCIWQDNVLKNGNFGHNDTLTDWTVWIDDSAKGKFSNQALYSRDHYDPGDTNGRRAGAYLGGENDCCQPYRENPNDPTKREADQYIAQSVTIDTDKVEKLAIEFSYCLTTAETTREWEFDRFFIDLQVGGVGGGSALPAPLRYTNLNAVGNCASDSGNWRRRGKDVSINGSTDEVGGDGHFIVAKLNERYSGNLYLSLVFYSDVDSSKKSWFHFDAVKLKECRKP